MAIAAPATTEPDEDSEEDGSDTSEDDDPGVDDLEGPPEVVDVTFNQLPWVEVPIPRCDQVPLSEIRPVPRSTTGVQGCEGLVTSLDFFLQLFTPSILLAFVDATNSYASANKNRSGWVPVTLPEFKVFIALVLFFGIVQLPSPRMAWSSDSMFRLSWVSSMMTYKRFESIMYHWHWLDTNGVCEEDRQVRNRVNSFWTVQGFCDALVESFAAHYICPRGFYIDEQNIPCEGRQQSTCYQTSTPAKWHLKLYSLNCAETNYQLNFFMYQGRDEDCPPEMPATVYPIWYLLKGGFHWHKSMILYLEKWYTSIAAIKLCFSWGIHVVGTVRKNKKELPKDAIFHKTGRGKRGRGEMKCMAKPLDTSGQRYLYFTAWMDSKPVHLLHTIKPYQQTMQRAKKGTHQKEAIPQPTVVADYNFGRRSTENIDQLTSCYRNDMLSKKRQPRLFMHCLHTAVCNAHILFKFSTEVERGGAGFTLSNFTELLVFQLCEEHVASVQSDEPPVKKSRRLEACLADPGRLTGNHFPEKLRRCGAKATSDPRRKCKICSTKTGVFCVACNVALCIDASDTNRTCWEQYHTTPLSYKKK